MKKIINVKPKTKLVENSLKVGDKDYAVKLRRRVTDLSRALELAKKALQKAEANDQPDIAEQLRARIQELEDLLANYNVDTIDPEHSPIDSESEGEENDKSKSKAPDEEEQEVANKAKDEDSEDEELEDEDPDELDLNQVPPPEPEPEESQEEPKADEKGEGNNKDSKNKDKSDKEGDPEDDNEDGDGEDGEQENSNNDKQSQNGKQKDKQEEGDDKESDGGASEDDSDDDDASDNDKSKGGKNKEKAEDESEDEDDSIDNEGDGDSADDESDDQQKGSGKSGKKDQNSEDDADDNDSNGGGGEDDNSSDDSQNKNKSKGGSSSNNQDPNDEDDSDSESVEAEDDSEDSDSEDEDDSEDSQEQNGNGQSSQKQPNKSQQNSDEKNDSKSQSKPTLNQEEDDEDGGGESEFQNPFADDEDISSNGGLPMGGKPPRQATKDETIELLGTLTGEGKEGAIDALKELIAKRKAATPVESFKPLGGQSLTEAIKSVRDMTDDEFGDYINDTYDLIDQAEKVDYVDDIEDRKKKIKDWSQDPTVIQDLFGEDSLERQKDYQKKKARDAAKTKYSSLASLDDFEMDFYSAIHNQIEMVRQEILSYDEINAEYESEDIIMKAEVTKEIPAEAKPVIDIYFDVSGSWEEKDIKIGEAAIASVKIFEDQGDIVMNIFYFSDGVDNVSMQHCRETYGTGTHAWPEILQNIKATEAKNVLVMTDGDFDWLSEHNYPTSPKMNGSITVEGCVWYLWKNGEASPSCLPKLKGRQGTYQYSFNG